MSYNKGFFTGMLVAYAVSILGVYGLPLLGQKLNPGFWAAGIALALVGLKVNRR